MVKPSLRTRSIGTKVTEEEYEELEHTARASGKTLGKWLHEVILATVNGHTQNGQSADSAAAQALMAEFVALRTILLNVLFRQANGESLTAEQMQTLIERADGDKHKKAVERLRCASKSAGG